MQKNAIVGIPDKGNFGDLDRLTPGMIAALIVQAHNAKRAGKHFDYRIGTPSTTLFSWASKKPLPEPGEERAWFQQPMHSWKYKDYEGEIVPGYGHGSVRKDYEGKVVITRVTPTTISFSKMSDRHPERFVLVRPTDPQSKRWLIINNTPRESIEYQKPSYKTIDADKVPERLKNLEPGASVQAKLDGAHAIVDLAKDSPEIWSHRVSATTGANVLHTERVFGGRPQLDVPPELQDSRVTGELYAESKGKALPVQELSATLNSSPENAINRLATAKAKMRVMLFDAQRVGGQDVTGQPYAARMKTLKAIAALMPDRFTTPEEAKTPEEALQLYHDVKEGRNPLTSEGIVVHPPQGPTEKAPNRKEHDVYIRAILPGEGELEGTAAGAFGFSWDPDGPVVGKVGTGFDDVTRERMHKSPDEFLGRRARVSALERLPSGALRAPSFVTLHEDY